MVKYIKIVREYKISLKDLDCDKVRKLEDDRLIGEDILTLAEMVRNREFKVE